MKICNHKGVDQHKVAQCHFSAQGMVGSQQHGGGHRHGNNQRLPAVQGKQTEPVLAAGLLPLGQLFIIAAGFVVFVAEVFHRFKVQQAVDRATAAA